MYPIEFTATETWHKALENERKGKIRVVKLNANSPNISPIKPPKIVNMTSSMNIEEVSENDRQNK